MKTKSKVLKNVTRNVVKGKRATMKEMELKTKIKSTTNTIFYQDCAISISDSTKQAQYSRCVLQHNLMSTAVFSEIN